MPAKKRKRTTRRKAPKTRTRTRTVVKYRTRRAPQRKRRRNPSTRRGIGGINIQGIAKNVLPMLLGALAGKAISKRFSDTGGELQNWSWSNYLLVLAGGFAASLANRHIFRRSAATSQKVMEGAVLLAAYKWLTLEVAPKNSVLANWFGATDEREAALIESAAAAIDPYSGLYGEITEEAEGDFQMLGQHYVPALGQMLEPATARMGQVLEPATARMGSVTSEFEAAYR